MAYHSGLIPGGYLGVDVFFTLSGFLITVLLLEEHARNGRIRLVRFYVRRALRLLPALLVVVAVCAAGTIVWAAPERSQGLWIDVLAVLFYVANWAIVLGRPLYVLSHAWSLAIEEQFYVLWPLLIAALLARTGRRGLIALVALVGAAAVLMLRLSAVQADPSRLVIYVGLHMRGDGLLLGCALGSWFVASRPLGDRAVLGLRIVGWGAAAALVTLYAYATWPGDYSRRAASTLASLAATGLIAHSVMADSPLARILASGPLVIVGRLSYGLYLWHFPVFYACQGLSYGGYYPPAGRIVVAWVLSLCVAALSYVLLERPLLRLKSRWAS